MLSRSLLLCVALFAASCGAPDDMQSSSGTAAVRADLPIAMALGPTGNLQSDSHELLISTVADNSSIETVFVCLVTKVEECHAQTASRIATVHAASTGGRHFYRTTSAVTL